ncbi:MAG: glycerol-3-phosphate acyltransferase PlsY [Phycisphaerales bacterium]|jgi:glycerol-3-phosphate acyltransferase PlsY
MNWPTAIIAAALAGSIPFSWLLGLLNGVDIRKHGSGNVGATNLGRVVGRKWFAMGFTLDLLKGFVPVFLAGQTMGVVGTFAIGPADSWFWLACVVAAVLGHMFSPIVGFKGGKGVATGLGAVLGIFPALTIPGVGAFVVFAMTLTLWRYVSVASTVAAMTLPAFAYMAFGYAKTIAETRAFEGVTRDSVTVEMAEQIRLNATANIDGFPFVVVTAAIAILVAYKHRDNFERLSRGTEPKMGSAKEPHENMPEPDQPDPPQPDPPQPDPSE